MDINKIFYGEFPRDKYPYIDEFLRASAKQHNVSVDDVKKQACADIEDPNPLATDCFYARYGLFVMEYAESIEILNEIGERLQPDAI